MEWLNFFIILISNGICLVWAFKKRLEINSTRVTINDDAGFNEEEKKQQEENIFKDKEDLEYVAQTCEKVISGILTRYHKYMLVSIGIATIFVWLFLEENYFTFSEPLLFFIGAYIQVF